MTFLRLSRWDWLAFVAAMALLVVMSADWYTTRQGEECRRIERLQTPAGQLLGGQTGTSVRQQARECAERREKNAWQAPAAIDRVIAFVLLVAIAAAVVAAFFRAAGRRFEPPLTPGAIAAFAGLTGALLVLYRILQPPGFNPAAVVKWGAPVGLALVGLLAIAARSASVAGREAPAAETEPAAEPATEAVSQPTVEPEAETVVEPKAEPAPEAERRAEEAPEAETAPLPDDEPEPEPPGSPGGFATGGATG